MRSLHLTIIVQLSIAAIAAVSLAACSPAAAAPTVSGAWVRATAAAGQPTAAYMTIANAGGGPDALLSASTPAASSVEIHQTSTDASGMTGMTPVRVVDIPAGGSVTLRPGGTHLMITGLAEPLTAGGTLELRLVFEHGGTVVVQAEVRGG